MIESSEEMARIFVEGYEEGLAVLGGPPPPRALHDAPATLSPERLSQVAEIVKTHRATPVQIQTYLYLLKQTGHKTIFDDFRLGVTFVESFHIRQHINLGLQLGTFSTNYGLISLVDRSILRPANKDMVALLLALQSRITWADDPSRGARTAALILWYFDCGLWGPRVNELIRVGHGVQARAFREARKVVRYLRGRGARMKEDIEFNLLLPGRLQNYAPQKQRWLIAYAASRCGAEAVQKRRERHRIFLEKNA